MNQTNEIYESDLAAKLAEIKELRKRPTHRTRTSKLALHRAEIIKLRDIGASLGDLALYMRREKNILVDTSTIHRALNKWEEGRQQ